MVITYLTLLVKGKPLALFHIHFDSVWREPICRHGIKKRRKQHRHLHTSSNNSFDHHHILVYVRSHTLIYSRRFYKWFTVATDLYQMNFSHGTWEWSLCTYHHTVRRKRLNINLNEKGSVNDYSNLKLYCGHVTLLWSNVTYLKSCNKKCTTNMT